MKIDKKNPKHWFALGGFFLQAALGASLRILVRRRPEAKVVILYGHKLNGNLLALYEYLSAHPEADLRPVFLSMDRRYVDELAEAGIDSCWASGMSCAHLLRDASAMVSDHGLHSMQPWRPIYQRLGLGFFDVWHAIPFKGFDEDDFKALHAFDEIWVASELNRHLYVSKFGFQSERVVVTGYGRTDRLVRCHADPAETRRSLGLPAEGKLVLFAPTWTQDSPERSLYPFGCSGSEFLAALANAVGGHRASLIMRSHLNSGDVDGGEWPNVYSLPSTRYPDTESILLISDVLICDWSSIAFDYLLLERPAIFLDVEPPFRKGLTLGKEFRYGPVVSRLDDLEKLVVEFLSVPQTYENRYGRHHRKIRKMVYGGYADGQSAKRYADRLRNYLGDPQEARL